MRSFLIGLVVGVSWLQMQAALPHYTLLLLLIAALAALTTLGARARRKRIRIPSYFIAGAIFGFVWAALFAHVYLSDELARDLEGQDIRVVGTIDSLPRVFERGERFNFAVEQVFRPDGTPLEGVPSRLALSWYSAFNAEELQAVGAVRPGERWQFTVRLRRPHGNANPHGFDYEAWLLEQNIRATGQVRPDQQALMKNERLSPFVFSLHNMVQRGRAKLRDRVEIALQDQPYAGVIAALVVGEQSSVSQADWEIFNRTGIGHLISISGLHITMIAALFAGLIFALWRRSFFTRMALPLRMPAQKAAALAGAFAAIVYVLLAGAGVPAQRTLYMLLVVAFALWSGRITSVSHILCISLGVVLVLDPWAVLGPGFWLSFAAVAVILYVTVGRAQLLPTSGTARHAGSLKTAVVTQYAITLGLVPLTLFLFAQTSLVSPLANAVSIPLVSFLVTPLALLGSVLPSPLSVWLLGTAHFLIAQLAQWLGWLSSFSFAVWTAPSPSWWMLVLAAIGTVWLLAPRGWPARALGLFAWLPMVLNTASHPPAGEVWVTAFDVGQGMALLVETENHRLLYDTGPVYSPESDGGNRVILPYLRARGIYHLDAIMVSHSDMDHVGGAISIMKEIRADSIMSSLPDLHPVVTAARNHQRCAAGQSWQWDGVTFELLHPTTGSYLSDKWKPNARSCTLKITNGKHAVLLPGDIEAVQEAELVEAQGDKLRADILLAPHHGSGTSSTLPFLTAVDPDYALFQVGYRNRYRHPKKEIFERYGELGIQRLRNDESGAIVVKLGAAIDVSEYRTEHARYWYER